MVKEANAGESERKIMRNESALRVAFRKCKSLITLVTCKTFCSHVSDRAGDRTTHTTIYQIY